MTTVRSRDPNVYMTDLLVDERTCVATPDQFARLMEYSSSIPTGRYAGKRWKRFASSKWWLGEFFEMDPPESGALEIRWRELVVVQ